MALGILSHAHYAWLWDNRQVIGRWSRGDPRRPGWRPVLRSCRQLTLPWDDRIHPLVQQMIHGIALSPPRRHTLDSTSCSLYPIGGLFSWITRSLSRQQTHTCFEINTCMCVRRFAVAPAVGDATPHSRVLIDRDSCTVCVACIV
jgi:hypothetical protein